MGILEDPAGSVQSGTEGGPATGAGSDGDALFAGEGLGAITEVLGAEQLTADGPGEQILPGIGSGWEKAGKDAATAGLAPGPSAGDGLGPRREPNA